MLGLECLNDEVEHSPTGVDECNKFHRYKFIANSDEPITILLCNSSNGYNFQEYLTDSYMIIIYEFNCNKDLYIYIRVFVCGE